MNDENIHIKDPDDDKIIVKDNTQIVKLQGPQGDPGHRGLLALQGHKVNLVEMVLTE